MEKDIFPGSELQSLKQKYIEAAEKLQMSLEYIMPKYEELKKTSEFSGNMKSFTTEVEVPYDLYAKKLRDRGIDPDTIFNVVVPRLVSQKTKTTLPPSFKIKRKDGTIIRIWIHGARPDDDIITFSLREIRKLKETSPSDVEAIIKAKQTFEGELVA